MPWEKDGEFFDRCREAGIWPEFGSRLDGMIPRDDAPAALEQLGKLSVSTETLDRWAEQRWFAWRPLPDYEPALVMGVPVYVVDRLILFHQLTGEGWTDAELAAYAEYEDEFVETILLDERIPMPAEADEGLASAIVLISDELRRYEDEQGARRPREEWPAGWHWRSRSSEIQELSDAELTERIRGVSRLLERLKTRGWAAVKPETAERIRRSAFIQANWEELVSVMMLEDERFPLRAGVSWFLLLACPQLHHTSFLSGRTEPETWVAELRISWDDALRRPHCGDNGEELPIRLPGLLLENGHISLTGTILRPNVYAEAYQRWDLDTYIQLRAARAGDRLCAHCHKPIEGPPKKRYCSAACSHAGRQADYRERQRPARERSPGLADDISD